MQRLLSYQHAKNADERTDRQTAFQLYIVDKGKNSFEGHLLGHIWFHVLIHTYLFDDFLVVLMIAIAGGELAGVVRVLIPIKLVVVGATKTNCLLVLLVFEATKTNCCCAIVPVSI